MLGNRFVNYSGPGGVRRGMIWQSSTASNEEPDPHNFICEGLEQGSYDSGYENSDIGYKIAGEESTIEPYSNGIFGYQIIVNDVGTGSHNYRYQQYVDNQAKIIFFDQIILPDIYENSESTDPTNVYGNLITDHKRYHVYSHTYYSSSGSKISDKYYYAPFPYRIKGFCLVANMNCFFNTYYYNNIEHIDAKSATEYYNNILNSYTVDFKYKTTTKSSNNGSYFGYKFPFSSIKPIDNMHYYEFYSGEDNVSDCKKICLGNNIYTAENYIGIASYPELLCNKKIGNDSFSDFYNHYSIECDSSNGQISLPDTYKIPDQYLSLSINPPHSSSLGSSYSNTYRDYAFGYRYNRYSGSDVIPKTDTSPFYYRIGQGKILNSQYSLSSASNSSIDLLYKCGFNPGTNYEEKDVYDYSKMLGIPVNNGKNIYDGLCMENDFKKGEYLSFNINPFYSFCYEDNSNTENRTCNGGRYEYIGINATVSPFCLTK